LHTVFWWRRDVRGRDHLVDLGVDGSIIIRCIFRKWDVGVWTDLAQNTERWRAFVNALMNFGYHQMRGIS